ncbi:unnamed protein product [Caenorhabditis brenneri]
MATVSDNPVYLSQFHNSFIKEVQSVIESLLIYSLLILIVPLISMFLLKRFVFEALLGFAADEALIYSPVFFVVVVQLILAFWLFSASRREGR